MSDRRQTIAGVISAEITGRVRNRARGAALLLAAAALAGTAWLCAVVGVVVVLVPHLGPAGALFAVAGGLLLIATGILLAVRSMGRAERKAERQSATALAAMLGSAALGGTAKRHPWSMLALGGVIGLVALLLSSRPPEPGKDD